LIIFSSVR